MPDDRGHGHGGQDHDGRLPRPAPAKRRRHRYAPSKTARAGNLWPTAELLRPRSDGLLVMELTSSHLCFTSRSPAVAVITCFWPDHLELHGSLERYRAAKETIVRHAGSGRRRRRERGRRPPRSRSPSLSRDAASGSRWRTRSRKAPSCAEARSCCATREASGRCGSRPRSTARASRRCWPPRRGPRGRGGARGAPVARVRRLPLGSRRPAGPHGARRRRHGRHAGQDGGGARALRANRSVVLVAGGELESAGLARARLARGARDCSRAPARRRVASRGSSSSSVRPRRRWRRCSILAGRSSKAPSTRRSRPQPVTQRAPRCCSSRRCSRSRSRSGSGSPPRSRRLREPGIPADPPPLVVVTTIMCATKSAPTREEEK